MYKLSITISKVKTVVGLLLTRTAKRVSSEYLSDKLLINKWERFFPTLLWLLLVWFHEVALHSETMFCLWLLRREVWASLSRMACEQSLTPGGCSHIRLLQDQRLSVLTLNECNTCTFTHHIEFESQSQPSMQLTRYKCEVETSSAQTMNNELLLRLQQFILKWTFAFS